MGDNTKIEWADASWPVVNGCRRISPGCEHCYAERLISTRLAHMPKYKSLAVYGKNGPRWTGESRLWRQDLILPIRWRRPRRIFVADMGDLFFEEVTDAEIDEVFGVMWACRYMGGRRGDDGFPGHTFQILTKRAERMRDYMSQDRRKKWAYAAVRHGGGENPDPLFDSIVFAEGPHPRIWLGVSIEDQKRAEERMPFLQQTPAAVRWASIEPLLEHVDVSTWLTRRDIADFHAFTPEARAAYGKDGPRELLRRGLDWVVVGAESGPQARPFEIEWARSVVAQCKDAKVACFVKQLGPQPLVRMDDASMPGPRDTSGDPKAALRPVEMNHSKGGDILEFPKDLRVREFPAPESAAA